MGVLQKPVLIHPDLSMNLPLELIRAVNRTYLLHLLTIDPDTVLPPGKSLIAVITQENLGRLEDDEKIETTSPHKQVTKVMQRAFWDVVSLLSNALTICRTHVSRPLKSLTRLVPQNKMSSSSNFLPTSIKPFLLYYPLKTLFFAVSPSRHLLLLLPYIVLSLS